MATEMKDSGVPWIGQIPKDWNIHKIKYSCSMQAGDNLTSQVINEEGKFPVYGANGIRGYYNSYNCFGEHVLIGRQGALAGNIHYVKDKIWATDHAVVVSNITEIPKYFFYALTAMNLNQYAYETAAQPGISVEKIMNLNMVFPSLLMEKRIVFFLDSKCSEIDRIAADIQSEIDKLEEYKKSIITEAVTKGLDKNVTLQKTESNYWSNIPSHWQLVDIKYIFEIVKRIAGKDGYDILSITQHGIVKKDISTNEGQIASDYSGYQFLYPGEFAMNHMDLITGWVDLSEFFGVTSPDYRVFRLRNTDENDRHYWKYVMQLCYMCKIFYSLGQGVSNLGRWRLQTSAFNNFKVPVPPYSEQKEIANYLDKKCSEIDEAISEKQQQLSLLNSYKKSLIYEYVTGKKEVPDNA